MYLENSRLRQLYRLVFLFLCEMGIILQYDIVSRIGGSVGILTCYYTILSNFVCLLYFAYLVVWQPQKENPSVKGGVVLCIAITGLVYHFMLNGAMEAGVGAVAEVTFVEVLANTLVHYVVPIMTFLDYLLFSPKGGFKWKDPILWLSPAALYVVFILIRAEVSTATFAGFSGQSRYPYPFVDVDLYGAGMVALMVLGILVGFLLLGCLICGLDKLLGRKAR